MNRNIRLFRAITLIFSKKPLQLLHEPIVQGEASGGASMMEFYVFWCSGQNRNQNGVSVIMDERTSKDVVEERYDYKSGNFIW